MRIPDQRQAHLQAADVPLEKLAGNPQLSQNQKVGEVSRQFEAVLLRQVLNQAQQPAFKSNTAGSTVSRSIYQDLFTQQLADQISRSGSVGLAHSLQGQLQHQLKGPSSSTTASASHPLQSAHGKHLSSQHHTGQRTHSHHSPDTAKRQVSS